MINLICTFVDVKNDEGINETFEILMGRIYNKQFSPKPVETPVLRPPQTKAPTSALGSICSII